MARRVTFLVLAVLIMDALSVWSGGVEWGVATTPRAAGFWQPDGATPSGDVYPDVAIGGELLTGSLQAADWNLGISDFLSDLAPNTASMTFVGSVSGVPGADVIISTGLGVQWLGRLDTVTVTRDTAGNEWTTITATDKVGALGEAQAEGAVVGGGGSSDLVEFAAQLTAGTGIEIELIDGSATFLPQLDSVAPTFTGTVLEFLAAAAKASNAMVSMQRDGTFLAVLRESVTPSSVLTLSGADAPRSWTLQTSIAVDVNRWVYDDDLMGSDAADIAIYGDRPYVVTDFEASVDTAVALDDWMTYGGSQRPTASGELTVSAWTQDDLILLEPFQWVTESGTAWQVLSVRHSVAVGESWKVSITADNLLDLL